VSAALAEQLLVLIALHCAAMPTVLVIDDLKWADQGQRRSVGDGWPGRCGRRGYCWSG
jgi:hypothetical protein